MYLGALASLENVIVSFLIWCAIIIIIIIKKDWQCKARRGRFTPYQYEDPSPTLPTYRGKEKKEKIAEDKKGEQLGQQKGNEPALETRKSHTIEYGVTRSFQRDTERGIKVQQYCKVLQRGGA